MSQKNAVRVLLLDEDRVFARRLIERLADEGIEVHWRRSLFELGSVGRLGDYDLIVVEPLIGPVNGLEIAEYAETFFPGLPVLFVGRDDRPSGLWIWPRSVVEMVGKQSDIDVVVRAVKRHGGGLAVARPHTRLAQYSRCASA